MGKASRTPLLSCIIVIVLFYLMHIIRSEDSVIAGLYNSLIHAKDGNEEVVKITPSLNKVVNQNRRSSQWIKDGIFWSDFAELFVPTGSSIKNITKIVSYLRSQDVKSLTEANKTDCGGEDNGIAVLRDGTRMCVRHRLYKSKTQGDALAFHLSRMLKMDNVPDMFLTEVSNYTSLWKQLNISTLPWKKTETVLMIKWIPDARERCLLPPIVREAYRLRAPITEEVIRSSELAGNPASIANLIQLGTLIVFDYLIFQQDRLHHKLKEWQHSRSGDIGIHNTIQSSNGKVWLIDNERTFTYRSVERNIRLVEFHNRMLKTMCVFQSSLVTTLKILSEETSAFKRLLGYSKSFEPLLNTIYLHANYRSDTIASQFDDRLATIMAWIQTCKEKYT